MVDGELTDLGKLFASLFNSTPREEPSWRFDEEEGTKHEHSTRNELDGERNTPLHNRDGKRLDDTVVDEETNNTTNLPADFVQTNSLNHEPEQGQSRKCTWASSWRRHR